MTTKNSEIKDYKLRTTVLKSFRSRRKFSMAVVIQNRDLLSAKTLSTPSQKFNFVFFVVKSWLSAEPLLQPDCAILHPRSSVVAA